MTSKTIQLSARVTEEDAAFLGRLPLEGAQTPSDKIRALIGDARQRYEGARDYRGALRRVSELLAPSHHELQAAEHATGKRSELVRLLEDWLPETLAFLMTEVAQGTAERPDAAKALERAERGAADRVFTLVEAVLRLGVTERAPCYDPQAVARRLGPALDLLEVISARRRTEPGPNAKQGASK